MMVLALGSSLEMRRAFHGGGNPAPISAVHTPAQPCGVAGFESGTWSPVPDLETAPSELESQMNRSWNLSPLSFRGSLTAICFRMSMLALSTPTAKNENFFSLSP